MLDAQKALHDGFLVGRFCKLASECGSLVTQLLTSNDAGLGWCALQSESGSLCHSDGEPLRRYAVAYRSVRCTQSP